MANDMSGKDRYEQISEWLDVYHSTDDDDKKYEAKTQICSKMIPVVNKIARTIARRSYDPIEDMVQAGFIGLLKAIDKYDKTKNDNFRVYAGYLIVGEIRHYLRDKLNMIRVPRHIQELAIRINNFTRDLTPEEVMCLTSEEVASVLNSSAKAVDIAMDVERRKLTVSLDDIFSDADSLGYEELIQSNDYETTAAYNDARILFNKVIEMLPPEEKILVEMYYTQNMTKKEIAEALVMSPMSVTRRMKQAFNKMAAMIVDEKEQTKLNENNIK